MLILGAFFPPTQVSLLSLRKSGSCPLGCTLRLRCLRTETTSLARWDVLCLFALRSMEAILVCLTLRSDSLVRQSHDGSASIETTALGCQCRRVRTQAFPAAGREERRGFSRLSMHGGSISRRGRAGQPFLAEQRRMKLSICSPDATSRTGTQTALYHSRHVVRVCISHSGNVEPATPPALVFCVGR